MAKHRLFGEQAKEKTRALPKSSKKIGTHSGNFQADEALACWFLRQLPDYAGAEVVRSRDPAVLDELDIVVDVGGIYDLEKRRFDHHQRGFFETLDGEVGKATCAEEATGRWKTKLSASGLVYKHYGRDIVARLSGLMGENVELAWAQVYDGLLEGVDAIDNGIEICEGLPKYKQGSDVSSRVARLNPRWNEESDHADQCARFEEASLLCGEEFLEVLSEVAEAWLPARANVKDSLARRLQVHPSGHVMKLESGGLPWREHLYELEREAGCEGCIMYVLYQDQSGMWRIQAVTVEGTLFQNRLSLPEPWRGLRNEALVEKSKIADCAFVHANGFIGGNMTYEGVIAMATEALKGLTPP